MAIFTVKMVADENSIEIQADGFKTADNGCLVFYQTDESGRNSTCFVAGAGRWDYFEPNV
jgi:hypothetical protein